MMSNQQEESRTEEDPPKALTLADLKSRQCSVEELQSALIQLIELYNDQGKRMETAIRELQRYRDSRRDADWLNTPYGS